MLDKPPTSIHLWFSEPIQTVRHGITVIAPSGKPLETGPIKATEAEMEVEIKATEQGTYQVFWQAISGDTHPVRGRFLFSVGHTSPITEGSSSLAGTGELGAVSGLGLALQTIAHWLHFLGYALAFGALCFRRFVLYPARLASPDQEKVEKRLWRLVNWGGLALLMAEPVALLGQTGSLRTDQLFDADLAGDILSSSFGRVMAQRLAAVVLLWVLLAGVRQGAVAAERMALGLGLLLALADGQASHAVTSGPLFVGLAANTIHLAAMGVWVGGLAALVLNLDLLLASSRPNYNLIKRFGRLAGIGLAWLVASGILMAWLHLSQPLDLFTTAYGRTLTFKVLALLGAVGLALTGRYLSKQPMVRRWWGLELVLLSVALGLAGLLIALPPPA
jgi:copper transport protein